MSIGEIPSRNETGCINHTRLGTGSACVLNDMAGQAVGMTLHGHPSEPDMKYQHQNAMSSCGPVTALNEPILLLVACFTNMCISAFLDDLPMCNQETSDVCTIT